MKVVILHQHFKTPYEGGAIRSYYLGKALADAGIQTIVVTATNERRQYIQQIDGMEVHYLPVDYRNEYGFLRRGRAFISFAQKAIGHFKSLHDIDLCYAISVPLTVGWAAMRIRQRYSVPFVFEVGDLWPDAPIEMGFVKNSFLKRLLISLEKTIYEKALAVVALSTAIRSAIQLKVPGKEVHLIPNMADTDFFVAGPKSPQLVDRYHVHDKFVISYIGAIGFANGLHQLIPMAQACEVAGLPVAVLICGEGAMRAQLETAISTAGLRNISLLPFTNRDGVQDILNVTDAVFISFQPFSILETGSPNKYFDGLAAGKIILTNFKGWVKEEIEGQQCGRYVDGPQSLVSLITSYLANPPSVTASQTKARLLAKEKYSRALLSDAFVKLIRQYEPR